MITVTLDTPTGHEEAEAATPEDAIFAARTIWDEAVGDRPLQGFTRALGAHVHRGRHRRPPTGRSTAMRTRMKIRDIEQAMADGTQVAAGKYRTRPATVLAVRQERRVYSGARWDFGGHRAQDGVKVRYEDGTEEVLGPTEILDTWDNRQATVAAGRQDEADRQRQMDEQKAACEAAVARLGCGTVAMKYRQGARYSDLPKHVGWEVKLTADEASQLAERLT